jgi:hypothetical protein
MEHGPSYLTSDNHMGSHEPPTAAALLGKIPPAPPNKGLEFKALQEQRAVLEQPAASQADLGEPGSKSRRIFGASKSVRLRTLASTMNKTLEPTLGVLAGTCQSLLDDLDRLGDLGMCSEVWRPVLHLA